MWAALAIAVSVAVLGVRAAETAGDVVAFGRILVSALALGAFFLTRRHSLAKRLLLALAIETTAGVALFTLVDIPFLRSYAPQITRTTATLLVGLERASALSARANAMPARK